MQHIFMISFYITTLQVAPFAKTAPKSRHPRECGIPSVSGFQADTARCGDIFALMLSLALLETALSP
jgi:hypothetical protein